MHIFATIIGILALVIAWWYKIRSAGKITREVADIFGITPGNLSQKALRKLSSNSPITAIQNPLVAAATIIIAIQSEEFVLGQSDEDFIEGLLSPLGEAAQVDEAMTYGKWAAFEISDINVIIDKLGEFLKYQLDKSEKTQFLSMLDEANLEICGCYDYKASRLHLASKLGLEVLH